MSVSPASLVVAYARGGVPWRTLAAEFGMPIQEVGDLVEAAALTDIRAREVVTGAVLLGDDLSRCLVKSCGRRRLYRRWCSTHYGRLFTGHEMLLPVGRQSVLLTACTVCGVTWCALGARRRPTLCGSRACVRARYEAGMDARARAREQKLADEGNPRAERDQRILERIRRDDLLKVIADDFGLSPARVNQIANRAGIYRRLPRGKTQRRARASEQR